MIRYENSIPDRQDFYRLFETTRWNENYQLSADELVIALENSWMCISAYDGDELIGFGRIVSDQVVHAMIYDLIVHPDFQNQGIGSRILEILVGICRSANIRDIQLFSAKGKAEFYLERGFEFRHPDAPGMQYRRQG